MAATVIQALIFFWVIGWIVHCIMGRDGGPLHYCFIGGTGTGVGAFLEWITNRYNTTFWGAMLLAVLSAMLVEYLMRRLKRKFPPKGDSDATIY